MVLPAIGILTAASAFSTHAGHDFKAAYDYVYYDDFRVNNPMELTEKERGWHKSLKKLIVDNEAITPEMWQQMSRVHSATYLHEYFFNLPVEFKEQIDQVLFGKKMI